MDKPKITMDHLEGTMPRDIKLGLLGIRGPKEMERLKRLRMLPEVALSQVGTLKLLKKSDMTELLGARYPENRFWKKGLDGKMKYIGPEPDGAGGWRTRGPKDSLRQGSYIDRGPRRGPGRPRKIRDGEGGE